MTPRCIVSSFASTGICPFNRNLFPDAELVPSAVTDRDFVNQAEQQPSCSYSAEPSLAAILEQEETSQEQEIAAEDSISNSAVAQGRSVEYVSASAIHPFPRVRQASKAPTRRRKKGFSKILTDTPVRNQIMWSAIEKKKKEEEPSEETATGKKIFFAQGRHDKTSSESECEVHLDNYSNDCIEDEDCIECDFPIVKIDGKGRVKHVTARTDAIDDADQSYEGEFLKKTASKTCKSNPIFVVDEEDEASFPQK